MTLQLNLDLFVAEAIEQAKAESAIEAECRQFLFGENGIPPRDFSMDLSVGQFSAFWYDGVERAREWEQRYSELLAPIEEQISQLSDELRAIKGSSKEAKEQRRPLRERLQALRTEREKLHRLGLLGHRLQAEDFEALQEQFIAAVWGQWEARAPKPTEDEMDAAAEDVNDTVYEERGFELTFYWTLQDAADVAITAAVTEEPEADPAFCEAYLRARRRHKNGTLTDSIELTRAELYYGSGFIRRLAARAGIPVKGERPPEKETAAADASATAH